MVAGVWVGGSCVFRVDLGLRVGNPGDSGRSLNGSLGFLFCPRCVGIWNLGNWGGGRWFLGSNFHFFVGFGKIVPVCWLGSWDHCPERRVVVSCLFSCPVHFRGFV